MRIDHKKAQHCCQYWALRYERLTFESGLGGRRKRPCSLRIQRCLCSGGSGCFRCLLCSRLFSGLFHSWFFGSWFFGSSFLGGCFFSWSGFFGCWLFSGYFFSCWLFSCNGLFGWSCFFSCWLLGCGYFFSCRFLGRDGLLCGSSFFCCCFFCSCHDFLLDQVENSTERERLVLVGLHKAIHGAEETPNTMNAGKPQRTTPEGIANCGLKRGCIEGVFRRSVPGQSPASLVLDDPGFKEIAFFLQVNHFAHPGERVLFIGEKCL